MNINDDLIKEVVKIWNRYSIQGDPEHSEYCCQELHGGKCTCDYKEQWVKYAKNYNKLLDLFKELEKITGFNRFADLEESN